MNRDLQAEAAKPLKGWRVLVPRGGPWGDSVAATLRAQGAVPVIAPLINFAPSTDQDTLEAALAGTGFAVAVGHGLAQGTHDLCRGCRMPVSEAGRASPNYLEGVCCDRCHGTRDEDRRAGYAERQRQMELARKRGRPHIGSPPSAKTKVQPS